MGRRPKQPLLQRKYVWQKSLQYCKAISLQLIKINEKRKKENIQIDGQGAHEKMFNIANHSRNATQNYNDISSHTT